MDRFRAWLWWSLLTLTVLGFVALNAARGGAGEGAGNPGFGLMGQYAVGAEALLRSLGGPTQGAQQLRQLEQSVRSTTDRIRLVAVAGEIAGAAPALARLEGLREEELTEEEARDVDALARIYAGEELEAGERERLADRHDWFAHLALSHGKPDDDPARRAALAPARRTAAILLVATAVLLAVGLTGLVLFLLAILAWRGGRLRTAYVAPPPRPRDIVWLETVVLLLAGALLLAILPVFVPAAGEWTYVLVWALLAVPFWPLLRGVDRREWREALGLVRGRGIVREAAAGMAGYLAGVPVFVAGVLLTLLLAKVGGRDLGHPVFEEVREGGIGTVLAFLGACVWAPLVEEAVFRGAFYRYLRSRTATAVAGLLTGFLFAVVHPQGLAAVPALMSLGLVFALIRQWRGSLVGPMVAHASHNFALLLLATLLFG